MDEAIFALTVNSNHTLLPIGFPHIVYFLPPIGISLSCMPLPTSIGVSTISVFLFSLVPLFVTGGWPLIERISSRLSLFKLSLLHISWAPSYWVLYAVIAKSLTWLGILVRVHMYPLRIVFMALFVHLRTFRVVSYSMYFLLYWNNQKKGWNDFGWTRCA